MSPAAAGALKQKAKDQPEQRQYICLWFGALQSHLFGRREGTGEAGTRFVHELLQQASLPLWLLTLAHLATLSCQV